MHRILIILGQKNLITGSIFALAGLLGWISFEARSVDTTLVATLLFCIGFIATTTAKKTFLVLGATAFTLAIGEFSLAFLFQKEPLLVSPESSYGKSHYWTNSDLGSQAYPGRHTSKKVTADGQLVYDVVYSIGPDGFRITEVDEDTARIHINFFGCSLMFGEGLNDNQTLPSFVHAGNHRFSVKNFGWHGYGVHQALRILESNRDTRGDVNVLLTSPWHADRSACVPDYSNGSPRYRLLDNGSLVLDGSCGMKGSFLGPVLERSNIYQLIRFALRPSQDHQIDLYLAIIDRIKALSIARNQRFVVGFVKAEDAWFRGHYSNQKIVEHFKEMGIEVIDLTLGDSAVAIPREYYIHALDKHPSAKANEARAKLIVTYLQESYNP